MHVDGKKSFVVTPAVFLLLFFFFAFFFILLFFFFFLGGGGVGVGGLLFCYLVPRSLFSVEVVCVLCPFLMVPWFGL